LIFKADIFFNYHHTPDGERVEASMHFEKEVLSWFQMLRKMNVVQIWPAVTRALKFGHSPFDCAMAELFKLQQNGSVSDYHLKFFSLANHSAGLPDEAILNCFLSGLNVDIKRDVMVLSPPNLLRAVALARLYEEKYMSPSKALISYSNKYPPFSLSSTSNTTAAKIILTVTVPMAKPTLPPLLPNPPGPPYKSANVTRISPTEMQLRKEKGLCYFCDKKFSFSHKCPNRQLYVLQLCEENSNSVGNIDAQGTNTGLEKSEDHHLSLNALKGGLGVGTIKFIAHVGTLPITVLIDGGSSDNFLQPRVAKCLKLPIEPTLMFKVMVRNGHYMESKGLIQNFTLQT